MREPGHKCSTSYGFIDFCFWPECLRRHEDENVTARYPSQAARDSTGTTYRASASFVSNISIVCVASL